MARADGSPPPRTFTLIWPGLLAAALALSACDLLPTGGDAVRPSGEGVRGIERDVEMPEVFDLAEPGLWDGRPSLGGVWVAHPDVTDPERVVIRNAQTGTSVTGALFRRERDHPGPRFQISSEAANALGILPGAPTPIRVTAVRLQQVEPAPEPAAADATAETPQAAGELAPPRGWRALIPRRAPAPPPAALPAPDAAADSALEPATRAAPPTGGILR